MTLVDVVLNLLDPGIETEGFVFLVGRWAENLFTFIGLLNCLISHKPIVPSFEKDTTLFAI